MREGEREREEKRRKMISWEFFYDSLKLILSIKVIFFFQMQVTSNLYLYINYN